MKALSIDPEYCQHIRDEEKTIECRTWQTKYRGELLICASKVLVPGYISGHAYFTVNLTSIEPFREEHLEAAMMEEMPDAKCYAWHFDDVQEVYPIPVRGKMGLFDVDDSLIKYVQNEETDAMTDEEFEKFYEDYYRKNLIPLIYLPDLP